MNIGNLFGDALKYPLQDWTKLLTLGALSLIALLPFVFMFLIPFLTGNSAALAGMFLFIIIGLILMLLLDIIYAGYGVSIIKKTIALEEGLPEFDWGNQIINGLKVIILAVAYFIIPWILSIVIMFLGISLSAGAAMATDSAFALIFGNLLMFLVIGIIYLIFALLFVIALGRFAETDSLGAAINVTDIFDIISRIGWSNLILWLIVLIVIQILLYFVALILGMLIIGIILVPPFMLMYYSRAIGLLYNESKNNL